MSPRDNTLVRRLVPDDAASLVACFERCYGRSYASPVFYDVVGLRAMIESGALRSVVATVDNVLVGHTGFTVRHPAALAIEAGNTVVDPAFRGSGILGRLGSALTVLGHELGYIGYVHYPTTAHTIMQTRSVAGGGVETGVMLAYIPADTDYLEIDRPTGRLAATVVYQPLPPASPSGPARTVCLPGRYGFIETLYRHAHLERSIVIAEDRLDTAASRLLIRMNDRRGLLHVEVIAAGYDFALLIAQARANHHADVVHVDLDLGSPTVGAAVNALTPLDFFFCGLLPEFGVTDVLRLQWLADPEAGSRADLTNDGAKALLQHMAEELRLTRRQR